MALATTSAGGTPSVRMVLAKGFARDTGHLRFYTHYGSRKGQELAETPHAAAVMYWEEFGGRQLRIEGPVTRVPDDVADAYFATRAAASQLNAWVSEQSRTMSEDDLLQQRAARKVAEYGLDESALSASAPAAIPRPPHWGGFQIRTDRVEFWTEGAGRFHERVVYTRADGAQDWERARLQP